MRRAERLRKRREFGAVYRNGRPYRSSLLVIRMLKTEAPQNRFGFAVGATLGKAVVRNRTKRRLREAIRSLPLAPGWDVVVTARKGAEQASYKQLRDEAANLFRRAGLLREEYS